MANEPTWGELRHPKMRENPARMEVFLEKVKEGDEFSTNQGQFTISKSEYDKIVKIFLTPKLKVGGVPIKGRLGSKLVDIKYPKEFLKTPEFGGKGAGSTVRDEDRALTNLNKQLQNIKLKKKCNYIFIRVKGLTKPIVCAKFASTPGTPKSDFHAEDLDGNMTMFISHKGAKFSAGGELKSFGQQYGGLTDKGTQNAYRSNRELKNFLEAVAKDHSTRNGYENPNDFRKVGMSKNQPSYTRAVKNKSVVLKAIYGIDFGKSRGIENVDEYHVGAMKLQEVGDGIYEIKSDFKKNNGDLPSSGSKFQAFYHARFTAASKPVIQGDTYVRTRFLIVPRAMVPNTTIYV